MLACPNPEGKLEATVGMRSLDRRPRSISCQPRAAPPEEDLSHIDLPQRARQPFPPVRPRGFDAGVEWRNGRQGAQGLLHDDSASHELALSLLVWTHTGLVQGWGTEQDTEGEGGGGGGGKGGTDGRDQGG